MSIVLFPEEGLLTERLALKAINRNYAKELLNYHLVNKNHLRAWEVFREDSFYTLNVQEDRIDKMVNKMYENSSLHLLIFYKNTNALVGQCNFTNILREPFQACHLGFSLSAYAEGKGLMQEALNTAIDFVFKTYGLHRIMANFRPENDRSEVLLKKLGFEVEGKARSYLKINGEWADHILTSKINED
jgi:ribosomal-protein-alanine N-acetyltransferase